jgi:hypothetical protein
MQLKTSFLRNILLAIFVTCFGYGLFIWSSPHAQLENGPILKAVAQGVLIGQIYFWLQTKFYKTLGFLHFIHWIGYPIVFYFEVFKDVFFELWFWNLLFIQAVLVLSYEHVICWRRIPILKNLLIAAIWFIQLNVIPGLAGHTSLISPPFFIFYLALSIQVDIEDIEEDSGKIKTLAGLLGRDTASYLVIFLLTLFAFLIGLPWVWIMLALIVLQHEFRLPKGSYDALLFVLGLYFLLR